MRRACSLSVVLIFAATVGCTLIFAPPSHATTLEVKGGPGGSHFDLTCPAGQFLVGFHARAGAWVDAVGIFCAPYNATTKRLDDRNTDPRMTGGKGGGSQEAYCAPGEPMKGIGLAHTRGGGLDRQFVNTIDLFCELTNLNAKADRCISSGEGCGYVPSHTVGTIIMRGVDYKYDELKCPPEERATGIHGASGSAIDLMGLICARLAAGPPSKPFASSLEPGIDIPGSDYRNVVMNDNYPSSCRDVCNKEDRCKAWTWVKAGIQGAKPVCWLKTAVPATTKNANTVSGIKMTGGISVR